MASTVDPRASGFNATEFREAIRFAMNMGLPQDELQRVTFRWLEQKDFNIEDSEGLPYDFTSSPTITAAQQDVLVDAAVEFLGTSSINGTSIGGFNIPRAIVTLLDEDYDLVEGADEILLGENIYTIDFVAPPMGLFEVTVWQIYCSALDES